MDLISWIMVLFIIVLISYLLIAKRELEIVAVRKRNSLYYNLSFAVILLALTLTSELSFNARVQGILASLIFLCFLINVRGLTKEGINVFRFDNQGIAYREIDRIVLYAPPNAKVIKMNFFRYNFRGPLLEFKEDVAELEAFLKKNIPESTKLEVVTNEDDQYV